MKNACPPIYQVIALESIIMHNKHSVNNYNRIYSNKRPGASTFSKRGAIIGGKVSHLIKGL